MQKIDRNTEYDSLRQEILNSIAACDNYKIAMYTVTTAILCVAFELENPILFLMPYIVLFAFQWSISKKNENNIVIGAYIAVYLEDSSGWESNNIQLKRTMRRGNLYQTPTSFVSRLIGRISSAQLGALCSILSIIYSVLKMSCTTPKEFLPWTCIVLSVVLYILIALQTKDIFNLGSRKAAYIANLREAKKESCGQEKDGAMAKDDARLIPV